MINNNHAIAWQTESDKILKSYYGKEIGRIREYKYLCDNFGDALLDAVKESRKVSKRLNHTFK